jgi:5'-phosphate synthase pdxT subunit
MAGMPAFGTCAGCILLSDHVSSSLGGGDNVKVAHLNSLEAIAVYGEQHIGGLDVNTCRNFFGRQTRSFTTFSKSSDDAFENFPCIFIRAPAIASVGPRASALAKIEHEGEDITVAVRQENLLGTCFHPELSNDTRIHRYFLSMVEEHVRLS